jgi:hypothetical protein
MNSTSAADNLATIRLERCFLSNSWEIAVPDRTENLGHRFKSGREEYRVGSAVSQRCYHRHFPKERLQIAVQPDM